MEAINDPAALMAHFVELADQGRWQAIEALFAPNLAAVVSADAVRAAWEAEAVPLGDVVGLGVARTEPIDDALTRVSATVSFTKGDLAIFIATAGDGLLQGLRIAAPGEWTAPSYAAPKQFTEHEVVVGEGPLAVPGTLTVPRGAGPFPAAILLSGGGPFDRDGTAGPLKPLKDLAWGLGSRGVASVRFDKVGAVHAGVLAEMLEFTAADEYLPYVRDAFRQLDQNPEIDSDRIHVVGHSMGAKMAPRAAEAEPRIAGLVLMAADAAPMQRSAVRVVRYLAGLGLIPDETVAVMEGQAANVERADLSSSTPTDDLPLGYSGAYWLDMRGYDPVATAKNLTQPMLILQGGRDYQVTVEDDLALWRAGIGDRADVDIRVYAADNHMFAPGAGTSTPAEYATPANVDSVVVDDIVRWLAPEAPRGKRLFSGMRVRRG
ncbi:dienelactone hydrolase [Catenulispora sp. GAS73]|uniref:alpha/beta hydrolase n=1 Tax=Catenulispora sp. GAS73 TaxID=3156269 RepID=UPI003512EEA5